MSYNIVQISLITCNQNVHLGKTVFLDPKTNSPKSDYLGNQIVGDFIHTVGFPIDGKSEIDGLKNLLEALENKPAYLVQGIVPGLKPGKHKPLCTKEKASSRLDAITRTKKHLSPIPGPAYLIIDVDTRLTFAELQQHMTLMLPWFPQLAYIIQDSSSAGIYHNGTWYRDPEQGKHLFIPISNGELAGEIYDALHKMCWANGLGWLTLARDGSVLERSLVDRTMKNWSQPIYTSRAVATPTNTFGQIPKRIHANYGQVFDAVGFVQWYRNHAQSYDQQYRKLLSQAHRDIQTEKKRVEREYAKIVMTQFVDQGISAPDNMKTLLERRRSRILIAPDIIQLADRTVRVLDILLDPKTYHEQTCHDPSEPDYGDASKARIYSNLLAPYEPITIHSFAHSNRVFRLQYDFNSLESIILEPPANFDLRSQWMKMMYHSDITVGGGDYHTLLRRLSKTFYSTKPGLDRDFKEYRNMLQRQESGDLPDTEAAEDSLLNPIPDHTALVSPSENIHCIHIPAGLDPGTRIRYGFGKLNRLLGIVSRGNKTRIAYRQDCEVAASIITEFMSISEMEAVLAYLRRDEDVLDQNNPSLFSMWLRSKYANRYDKVMFQPEEKVSLRKTFEMPPAEVKGQHQRVLNLFEGYCIEPKPGDWSLIRQHLYEVWCLSDDEKFELVLDFLCNLVRFGWIKQEIALQMRSDYGSGKSTVLDKLFRPILGPHYLPALEISRLGSQFNALLESALLVIFEEVEGAGKKIDGIIRDMITGGYKTIEAKGIDATTRLNFSNVIFLTNKTTAAPSALNDRRVVTLNLSDHRRGDFEYFNALHAQLDGDGPAAFLHYLLNEHFQRKGQVGFKRLHKIQTHMTQRDSVSAMAGEEPVIRMFSLFLAEFNPALSYLKKPYTRNHYQLRGPDKNRPSYDVRCGHVLAEGFNVLANVSSWWDHPLYIDRYDFYQWMFEQFSSHKKYGERFPPMYQAMGMLRERYGDIVEAPNRDAARIRLPFKEAYPGTDNRIAAVLFRPLGECRKMFDDRHLMKMPWTYEKDEREVFAIEEQALRSNEEIEE